MDYCQSCSSNFSVALDDGEAAFPFAAAATDIPAGVGAPFPDNVTEAEAEMDTRGLEFTSILCNKHFIIPPDEDDKDVPEGKPFSA